MSQTRPSVVVDDDLILKASRALLRHHVVMVKKQKQKKKNQGKPVALLEDHLGVYVQVSLRKMPEKPRNRPVLVDIPHPVYAESDVCVITKEPVKKYKEAIRESDVEVAKVLGLRSLQDKFRTFQNKRDLCHSYELFLVDRRISNEMPKLLGAAFFRRKKQPVQINVTKDIGAAITKAKSSTSMVCGAGNCFTVRVGRTDFTTEQLSENVSSAVASIASHLPGQWSNVQAMYLKTEKSIALPIFTALPKLTPAASQGLAIPEARPQRQKRQQQQQDDEDDEEEDEEDESFRIDEMNVSEDDDEFDSDDDEDDSDDVDDDESDDMEQQQQQQQQRKPPATLSRANGGVLKKRKRATDNSTVDDTPPAPQPSQQPKQQPRTPKATSKSAKHKLAMTPQPATQKSKRASTVAGTKPSRKRRKTLQ